MNTLSISIDDNFIIINTIEFYCVIFKNLKIDGALFGVVGNVPKEEGRVALSVVVEHGHSHHRRVVPQRAC